MSIRVVIGLVGVHSLLYALLIECDHPRSSNLLLDPSLLIMTTCKSVAVAGMPTYLPIRNFLLQIPLLKTSSPILTRLLSVPLTVTFLELIQASAVLLRTG